MTMLPQASAQSRELVRRAALHQEDLSAGFVRVWLPDVIAAHWIPNDEYRGRNVPASARRYTVN
jgi:hypothetical protein